MKERPILFSAPMVRAILDGSKTQTRRIVKPEHVSAYHDGVPALFKRFPYGKPGDRLWVRERHAIWTRPETQIYGFHFPEERGVYYWADQGAMQQVGRWRPSIHMPRWASRITLEVTGVRVERLQDISEEDAIAEGVGHELDEAYNAAEHAQIGGCPLQAGTPAQHAYAVLWESINGPGSWDKNPWVWCVNLMAIKS
jgi:hypothetical protein